jgi:hypothetical protein
MPNKMPDDASLQSTKQMLDELDALMEKMLTLPVSDVENAEAFPPPSMKGPPLSATLTLLEPSDSSPPPASKRPAHQKPKEEAGSEGTDTPWPFNPPHYSVPGNSADAPSPEPEPLTNEVVPPSVLPKLEPLMQEIAEAPGPSLGTQWLYLPLVWVNLGFDGVTRRLGGAGNWMRSEAGRMLLGLSGIALLAAAAVWFLKDWLGWNWGAWFIS